MKRVECKMRKDGQTRSSFCILHFAFCILHCFGSLHPSSSLQTCRARRPKVPQFSPVLLRSGRLPGRNVDAADHHGVAGLSAQRQARLHAGLNGVLRHVAGFLFNAAGWRIYRSLESPSDDPHHAEPGHAPVGGFGGIGRHPYAGRLAPVCAEPVSGDSQRD